MDFAGDGVIVRALGNKLFVLDGLRAIYFVFFVFSVLIELFLVLQLALLRHT